MAKKTFRLKADDVGIRITEEEIVGLDRGIPATFEIIGQPRALQALQLGTEIDAKGYNIFVTGFSGTGKRTAITRILKNYKPKVNKLKDIVFVYNFRKPDRPTVLYFPPGKAKLFKKDLHKLVENLKASIKTKLKSKRFQNQKEKLFRNVEMRENKVLTAFETRLAKEGFQIVQLGEGENQVTDILPVHKGQAVDFDDLQALVNTGEIDEKYWNTMREKYYLYMDEMKKVFKDLRMFRQEMEGDYHEISMKAIMPIVESEVESISTRYPEERVKCYLEELSRDINSHIYLFTETPEENGEMSFLRYGVNVAVDSSDTDSVPVIFENHPSYSNLFGVIESKMVRGVQKNNFMNIVAGSLIHATGGFLILKAEDILREESAWQALKNSLLTGKVEIQPGEPSFMIPGSVIKPEAVDIDVKVIVIGNPNLYDILYSIDEDFQKLFKVSAEFDSIIRRNRASMKNYIGFIKRIVENDGIKKINPSGIAKVIEYSVRIADRKDSLSTRFSQIADILREADYWAARMNKKVIDGKVVKRAIDEKNYLVNMPEEKIDEMIVAGDILLAVTGSAVGKINGLAVLDRGYYAFGKPTLITARISPGEDGIVNIEREAGLSGEFHDKGMLILEGLLRSRYSSKFPLSITATICFEQNYSAIDGDSASSAEVYALLSSIAGVPLRQDLAVTGSVNQLGEIQPIGGVTEKVESFFKICKAKKLTGKQGVVIPAQNIKNLILNDEVVAEVRKGRFHIYAVSTIDEGLGILTGTKVGTLNKNNQYPKDSLNGIIENKLYQLAQKVKEYRQ
ncbi:MAG: AAA family ATPase [Spirochaetales bacterium]|nr:AAA family ATPase [Spirochaetales bacterium]